MADRSLHLGARYLTFALAAVGAAFSAALLFVVMTQPQLIEEKLKSFAIAEVSAKGQDLLDTASESENGLLRGLAQRFGDDQDVVRDQLKTAMRTFLQERCGGDCPQVRGAALLDSFQLANRLATLKVGEKTVKDHLIDRYDATVSGLLGDLKTFGLANLVAFLTLIFLTIFRGQFGRKILPMTLLLMGYVGAATYWYVFSQDWASAILFNNWAAGGYVASMCVVYFLLIDFTFLKGKMTESIMHMIGSIFSNASV